jgi:SAM-dependent methyltransferase
MNGSIDPALQAYYDLGDERDRLSTAHGILEFERTKEIVLRHLPDPPSIVADIGGGPGRYAAWLAGRGHRVEHRDLMTMHVDQVRADVDPSQINAAVADARDLDLGDETVDAALLLGPIYHLLRRDHRIRAMREAGRIVRPGSPVFVAAISRWATRLDGVLRLRLYTSLPTIRDLAPQVERTGWLPPLFPGSFTAYTHRPQQLRSELRSAGFRVLDLVSVEGPAFLLHDLDQRLADPLDRAVVFEAARAVERVPELFGFGPHLLATAVRP